jgi:hypothetical protein
VVLYSLMPEHGVGELVHALLLHHMPVQGVVGSPSCLVVEYSSFTSLSACACTE